MIDRYLLRYFLAAVDHGNFTRAAAHCHVSQPTLSVGIAKLERELGATLLLRSNQRIQLTEAGDRFLLHARRIEAEFSAAQAAMSGTRSSPALRIGILHSIPTPLVAAAVRAHAGAAALSPIELTYGTEREIAGNLGRGRIDAALTLVGRGGDRFLERPLFSEPYAVALSSRHPLADRAELAAELLSSEPMIVRRHCEALAQTSRFFTDRGIRPHFALRTENDDLALAMVAEGLGLTIMPAGFDHPGVARPRLTGFQIERTIGFAYSHEAEHFDANPHPFIDEMMRAISTARSDTSKHPIKLGDDIA